MSLLDLWKCFRDGCFTFQLGFQVLSCWNHSQMNWWSPLGCSWHCLLKIQSLQLLCKFINIPVLNDNINTKQNSQFFLLKFGLWILPWNLRLIETEQDNFNLVIQATRCKTRISYSGTLSHSSGTVQCVDCQNIMHDSDFRRPYKSL